MHEHLYGAETVQDRLIQRTLNMRGPGLVPSVEIVRLVQTLDPKQNNKNELDPALDNGTAGKKEYADSSAKN
jgi:hypothetical protein